MEYGRRYQSILQGISYLIFHKIPFQYVLKGLERMKVFLNKGIAYVHKTVLLEAVIENYCQKI